MKRSALKWLVLPLLLTSLVPAFAADPASSTSSTSTPASTNSPASATAPAPPLVHSPAASLLAKPVTLRGKLGDQAIQVHLHLKEQIDEGVEGDYFLFGRTQKILLAGEVDNNTLALEESENGTDISGQWDGKIDGNVIRGTWTSADASVTKSFEVTAVDVAATAAAAPKKSGKFARHGRKIARSTPVFTSVPIAK